MKKIILLLVVAIFYSCTNEKYLIENNSSLRNIDFRSGKWLLNEIDAPTTVKEQITKDANKKLTLLIGNQLYFRQNEKGLLLPKKIPLNSNKEFLKDNLISTGFDYLINIKVELKRDDLIGVRFASQSKYDPAKKKISETTFEVYDLNVLEIIYSKKIIGTLEIPKKNGDIYYIKSSNKLMINGFNKLIKNLKKNSLKN